MRNIHFYARQSHLKIKVYNKINLHTETDTQIAETEAPTKLNIPLMTCLSAAQCLTETNGADFFPVWKEIWAVKTMTW